ncbi:MAG: glycosyltransferase family 2 protein [Drouetiella hepatica Uher 2000/2452]|uniref:Glycosyltransferase family 2 protein n=1 Tax=Drouetiella hepatica Uher 2000/2452 TaxID=904376 RepID=A0A951QEA7_9CYAN|nr:glycosyltransferase family 2 protein [Drouetiella hepatica Uher 2000/2452]
MQEPLLFSIVIPTYNRPDRLHKCLEAISQLNYSRENFEVIVVDDGSKIPLVSVIEPLQAVLNLTLLRQANAGPASARNAGAAIAQGKFIVFTDDDCIPTSDWLAALEVQFQLTPDALVGGKTLNALPENLYSTASQLLIDYLYGYYNAEATASFFASNNFALSTATFQLLKGFDTTFPLAAGEDREFCDRWLHQGYQMVYAPQVKVYHAHQLTFKTFWRQHFNYGRGAFCFHQVRTQRIHDRIQIEPISFYFNLLTYPLTQSSSQSGILLALLLFLSQVANVAGFFRERIKPASFKNSSLSPASLS